ncbi:hypothetical protein GOP47_0010505 [Adiantum capillus-veneris]|uniref:Uncharacterized protein n=1 Tax=Adiantum capillus-veneris TaxID=13818 RepID=A0A9D4ZGG5_ADICA|nr:hypothetical protein GOP47_0010505 [Adiantum capillus-veneris]
MVQLSDVDYFLITSAIVCASPFNSVFASGLFYHSEPYELWRSDHIPLARRLTNIKENYKFRKYGKRQEDPAQGLHSVLPTFAIFSQDTVYLLAARRKSV